MSLLCPICKSPAQELPHTGGATGCDCPTHGKFKAAHFGTGLAVMMIIGTWIGCVAWAAAAFYWPETKARSWCPIWLSPESDEFEPEVKMATKLWWPKSLLEVRRVLSPQRHSS